MTRALRRGHGYHLRLRQIVRHDAGHAIGELHVGAGLWIAFINSVVAGVGVALLVVDNFGPDQTALAMSLGVALAGALIAVFVAYERWRFRVFDRVEPREPDQQT